MVKRLALLVLVAGFAVNAGAASLYDDALAAYWRGDNVAAFEKCVAVLQARPAAADAAHARYLMEVICTTKHDSGMGTQEVARLQQTWQEWLYKSFCQATAPTEKERLGQTLAAMWRDGTLHDDVKETLAQEQFHVVLRQLGHDSPSWEVNVEFTFPFPDIWTEFTPTLYRNDEVKWAPGRKQTSRSMSVSGSAPITSMSGGEFKNGDVLQCQIDLRQKPKWQISLWTNKITLQGLKQ